MDIEFLKRFIDKIKTDGTTNIHFIGENGDFYTPRGMFEEDGEVYFVLSLDNINTKR